MFCFWKVVKDKFIYTVLSKCMIFTVHNPLGYDTHRFIYAEKTAGPLCIIKIIKIKSIITCMG